MRSQQTPSCNHRTPRITIAVLLLALGGALSIPAAAAQGNLAQPFAFSDRYDAGDRFMGIRLLGALEIAPGPGLVGLSGLAWDDDEGLLYALSDKGTVSHLRPILDHGILRDLERVAGYPLLDGKGHPLRGTRSDAEGLALEGAHNDVRGDTRLMVSFERRPRIQRFRPEGYVIDTIPVPSPLARASAYATPNKALESVTIHPTLGILTGPERSLRGINPNQVTVYDLNGRWWRFARADDTDSALVALEALPDGSLVLLERSVSPSAFRARITVRRSSILSRGNAGHTLPAAALAVFDSARGWRVDNFEGLARHRGMRFFMISDDNMNWLQKTLLVYFEITENLTEPRVGPGEGTRNPATGASGAPPK